MKICLINPNTTAAMTQKAASAARAVVSDDTQVIASNPAMGPESIEGFYDEVFSVPGLIEEIKKNSDADAYVLACFDDTGLDAARCCTERPVVAIGEAAYHLASMIGAKFGVVTTLSRSVAALEHNLIKYGLMARCSGVRASDVPVLELESITADGASNPAYDKICAEIEAAIKIDKAESIVLGCAGMADLPERLSREFSVPVVDGVAAAARMAESLAALGLTTSKIGAYAAPGAKQYSGIMRPFQP